MSRTLTSLGVSWGPAVLWAAVLFTFSAMPDTPGPGLLERIPAGDKLAHLVAYGILGGSLAWARRREYGRPASPWVHVAFVLLGAAYGLTDEWHQSFVPGREVSALDWLADLCGVTLGYSVASAARDPEPAHEDAQGDAQRDA